MRPDPAEEFSRRFAAAKAADNVRAFVAGYAALGDAQRQVRRVAAALDDLWTVIDPAGMDADDVADLFDLEERDRADGGAGRTRPAAARSRPRSEEARHRSAWARSPSTAPGRIAALFGPNSPLAAIVVGRRRRANRHGQIPEPLQSTVTRASEPRTAEISCAAGGRRRPFGDRSGTARYRESQRARGRGGVGDRRPSPRRRTQVPRRLPRTARHRSPHRRSARPVVGRLQGRFPCQVKVHLGGEAELKRADAAALSERIAEVVEAAFPSLHNQVWTTVVVPNCPFEVGVIKTEEFPGGTVYKSTGTPSDEATARRDSIIATLGKAVTKFDRYPRPQFDRVLLLDVADPQNDSPWSTGAAYRAAAEERPHLVTVFDFVFRVDTKYDFGDPVPPGDVQCLQHRELLWPETGTRWDDGRRSLTPAPDPRWRWGEAPRA
jgi:hypothetical protein